MKTIITFLSIILTSSLLYSQSSIVFDAGTNIDVGSGADVSAGTITVNGTYSGSGTFNNGPLPVELVSFTARIVKDNVELIWKTATEVNNYGFEIERMTPSQTLPLVGGGQGGGWSKVGFVEGKGTTSAPQSYSFNDAVAKAGKYLYRLKQIDRDGKFEYSQEVEVEIGSASKVFALEQNYPNPFNPTTVISYQLPVSNHVSLKVYDAIGREVATLVNEVKEAGTYSAKFDASKLSRSTSRVFDQNAGGIASGIYFYTLRAGQFTATKKLLLMK